MAIRQNAALHLAPLTLRVALGLVFLFYGAGKLFYEDMALTLDEEAQLVSLGIIDARPDGPQPPADVDATDGAMAPGFALIRVQDETAPAADPAVEDVQDAIDAIQGELDGITDADAADGAADDDEASGRTVRRLYGLIFPMNDAAQNGHWPDALSTGPWLKRMAWFATITEFVGGFLVLLGVFTRFWSFALMMTMLTAIWLTQCSPAIAAGDAFLGFLPPWPLGNEAEWMGAYQPLFFQLVLLLCAKALFLSGPGVLSVDYIIFGGSKKKNADHADHA